MILVYINKLLKDNAGMISALMLFNIGVLLSNVFLFTAICVNVLVAFGCSL